MFASFTSVDRFSNTSEHKEPLKEKTDLEDIDKGRAWLVATASMIACGIYCGTIYSVGIYNVAFLEEFDKSKSLTSWLCGTSTALSTLAGPLGSIVSNTFSIRTSVVLGGASVSIGLFCSAFIRSFWLLFGFFGFVTGLGYALLYPPSLVITGYYFDKKLNLANTMIGVGVSVATLTYPFAIEALVDWYGWRGSLTILAGISLNICACGILMKPNEISRESRGKIFDLQLLVNWKMVLLLFHGFFSGVGMSVVYVHLPAFMVKKCNTHSGTSLLISVIGISGCIGKLLSGIISRNPKISPVAVCAVSFTACGIATCVLPFHGSSFVEQIIYASIFGLTSAPLYVFCPSLLVSCVGVASLSTAMGLFMLVSGIGYFTGPPISGLLFDIMGSYNSCFLFGGSCWMMCTMVLLLPILIDKLRLLRKVGDRQMEDGVAYTDT